MGDIDKVTHALSIIFFSRTILEVDEEWQRKKMQREKNSSNSSSSRGKAAVGSFGSSPTSAEGHQSRVDEEREEAMFGTRGPLHARPQPMSSLASGGSSGGEQAAASSSSSSSSVPRYQDHYMVVVDCEVHDFRNWDDLMKLLKRKFNRYHLHLKWSQWPSSMQMGGSRVCWVVHDSHVGGAAHVLLVWLWFSNRETPDPITGLRGAPSNAAEGNFLEAISQYLFTLSVQWRDACSLPCLSAHFFPLCALLLLCGVSRLCCERVRQALLGP